jgi:hypothetical protein
MVVHVKLTEAKLASLRDPDGPANDLQQFWSGLKWNTIAFMCWWLNANDYVYDSSTTWYSTFQHRLLILCGVLAAQDYVGGRCSAITIPIHSMWAIRELCEEEIVTSHPKEANAILRELIPDLFSSFGAHPLPSQIRDVLYL